MKQLPPGISFGFRVSTLVTGLLLLAGCPRGESDRSGHDVPAAYQGSHEHATFHPRAEGHRPPFRSSMDRPMFKSSSSRPSGHIWLSGGAQRGGRK